MVYVTYTCKTVKWEVVSPGRHLKPVETDMRILFDLNSGINRVLKSNNGNRESLYQFAHDDRSRS